MQLPKLATALALTCMTTAAIAADIDVGVNGCTLIDAIDAANNDIATGGCPAGNGADTLHLPAGSTHVLTAINNTINDANGLPVIFTDITIEGNGSTVRRSPSSSTPPRFRIFAVGSGGTLTLDNVTVSDGFSEYGGGLHIAFGGTATLTGSTVARNGSGSQGGGINNSGTCVVSDTNVVDNRAEVRGGGIWNLGTLTVTGSTIANNTTVGHGVGTGGGIWNGGTAVLSNSTLYDNRSDSVGGAIHANDGSLSLTHVTVVLNWAEGSGAGLFVSSTVSLTHSLISTNICPACSGSGREIYGNISTTSFNLLGQSSLTNAQAFTFVPGATNITATSDGTAPTTPADIFSGGLQDNGGPTETIALAAGSPAIDAVTDGTCPPPATDQRGVTRPRDGDDDDTAACDIGAFESVNPTDTDGDGIAEADDLCPDTAGGAAVDGNGCADAQVDSDGDGVCNPGALSGGPSACSGSDNCPLDANAGQDDADGDTVGDVCDNCLLEFNPDQCNTNAPDADAADLGDDTIGNVCDADLDNNGIVNSFDLGLLRVNFGASGDSDADITCDGNVNSFDLTEMRQDFGQTPGPSGF